jgi:hypothetical protein
MLVFLSLGAFVATYYVLLLFYSVIRNPYKETILSNKYVDTNLNNEINAFFEFFKCLSQPNNRSEQNQNFYAPWWSRLILGMMSRNTIASKLNNFFIQLLLNESMREKMLTFLATKKEQIIFYPDDVEIIISIIKDRVRQKRAIDITPLLIAGINETFLFDILFALTMEELPCLSKIDTNHYVNIRNILQQSSAYAKEKKAMYESCLKNLFQESYRQETNLNCMIVLSDVKKSERKNIQVDLESNRKNFYNKIALLQNIEKCFEVEQFFAKLT